MVIVVIVRGMFKKFIVPKIHMEEIIIGDRAIIPIKNDFFLM